MEEKSDRWTSYNPLAYRPSTTTSRIESRLLRAVRCVPSALGGIDLRRLAIIVVRSFEQEPATTGKCSNSFSVLCAIAASQLDA